MPTYTFENKQTSERFDKNIKLADYDQYLTDHPELRRIVSAPRIVAGVGGIKMDDGFKEVLNKVKAGSARENTIRTK